jgi:predicted dehydrogenase
MQQKRTCLSENSLAEGLKPLDKGFGVEPEFMYGTLTTVKEFDPKVQKLDEPSGRYVGKLPTTPARWMGYYENIAAAIRGEAELEVKPTQSRNVLRLVELARESHETGRTVEWR